MPNVPYSGSLKSHLTAPLAARDRPARAFALVSVLFYAAFVAALFRLAQPAGPRASRWTPRGRGPLRRLCPAFVTRYSLSNDGNYVEVLALGTWALVLAVRWVRRASPRPPHPRAAAGILLGLAFWSHILAVIHVATARADRSLAAARRARLAAGPASSRPARPRLPARAAVERGRGLGVVPLPRSARGERRRGRAQGPGVLTRLWASLSDHAAGAARLRPRLPAARSTSLFRAAAWAASRSAGLAAGARPPRLAVRDRNGALVALLFFRP